MTENKNRRSRRRKAKDNPYRIHCLVDEAGQVHYFVSFEDSQSIRQIIEISRELFELFNQFELEDISHMNEVDRHYEQFELTEESMYARQFAPEITLEEIVWQRTLMEILYKALPDLPKKQQRRFKLYYLYGLTCEQIAAREGCSVAAVANSIKAAKKFLKKIQNFFD